MSRFDQKSLMHICKSHRTHQTKKRKVSHNLPHDDASPWTPPPGDAESFMYPHELFCRDGHQIPMRSADHKKRRSLRTPIQTLAIPEGQKVGTKKHNTFHIFHILELFILYQHFSFSLSLAELLLSIDDAFSQSEQAPFLSPSNSLTIPRLE